MKVHVCLVSDQPIPNLTTVFQFRPDRVVLLYTSDKRREKDRLEAVIKSKDCHVEGREIAPYDMGNVIGVCEQLFRDCPDCELSLNITGGTKVATVGTFQSFYSTDRPIWYVNTRDNEILQLAPTESRLAIEVRIQIKDYLAAHGFVVADYCKDDRLILARRAATEALLNLAIRSERSIGELNGKVTAAAEPGRFPCRISGLGGPIREVFPLLEQCGVGNEEGEALVVERKADADYLRGFWFEEYVYMTARGLGADEVKLNVTGQWDAAGREVPKNEFDVMLAKGNRLFYISCKTANPNRREAGEEGIGKEYLYELDSLGDRALGLFGKKLLVSARSVTDPYVRKRAAVMNIPLFDHNDLPNLKGKLKAWLNT
jgi:hypothetical protein